MSIATLLHQNIELWMYIIIYMYDVGVPVLVVIIHHGIEVGG
jgi:hypothetical protein